MRDWDVRYAWDRRYLSKPHFVADQTETKLLFAIHHECDSELLVIPELQPILKRRRPFIIPRSQKLLMFQVSTLHCGNFSTRRQFVHHLRLYMRFCLLFSISANLSSVISPPSQKSSSSTSPQSLSTSSSSGSSLRSSLLPFALSLWIVGTRASVLSHVRMRLVCGEGFFPSD